LGKFFALLTTSGVFYLWDCLGAASDHPELPWFERGIYEGGLAGFYLTVGFLAAAFWYLLFGKSK
jgi:hypothetical protein